MWATASIDRQSPALVGLISARFVITMTLIHIRITAEHLLDRYGIGTLYALVRCIDESVVALKDTSPWSTERAAEEGREVIGHRPRVWWNGRLARPLAEATGFSVGESYCSHQVG